MTKERFKEIKENLSRRIMYTEICGGTQYQNQEELELINYINELEKQRKQAIELNNKIIEEYKLNCGNEPSKLLYALEMQNKILQRK